MGDLKDQLTKHIDEAIGARVQLTGSRVSFLRGAMASSAPPV
jgi:hypothetical protein